ncbi:hypothetical protein LOC67_27005 [Stieleria sp. JC731]|uniref:hypothetical protein n=1 Tax=Stieleria sp. JC731 TaxID=2894195 RepID=UPI001E2F8E7A|nr:hypothetical protein [Stieleria sp. JC731]MCC9604219.1 hypothetical protein [Stieleria sp. JC731]
MCRYAVSGPYKLHFACFDCRTAFKQPSIDDWLAVRGKGYVYRELRDCTWNDLRLSERERELGFRLADLQSEYREAIFKCPNCGNPMADLGRDWRPPRRADVKAWRALAGVYALGHAFHSCGCDGPGFIPSTPSEYVYYLTERLDDAVQSLHQWEMSSADHAADACVWWRTRIAKIQAAMDMAEKSG